MDDRQTGQGPQRMSAHAGPTYGTTIDMEVAQQQQQQHLQQQQQQRGYAGGSTGSVQPYSTITTVNGSNSNGNGFYNGPQVGHQQLPQHQNQHQSHSYHSQHQSYSDVGLHFGYRDEPNGAHQGSGPSRGALRPEMSMPGQFPQHTQHAGCGLTQIPAQIPHNTPAGDFVGGFADTTGDTTGNTTGQEQNGGHTARWAPRGHDTTTASADIDSSSAHSGLGRPDSTANSIRAPAEVEHLSHGERPTVNTRQPMSTHLLSVAHVQGHQQQVNQQQHNTLGGHPPMQPLARRAMSEENPQIFAHSSQVSTTSSGKIGSDSVHNHHQQGQQSQQSAMATAQGHIPLADNNGQNQSGLQKSASTSSLHITSADSVGRSTSPVQMICSARVLAQEKVHMDNIRYLILLIQESSKYGFANNSNSSNGNNGLDANQQPPLPPNASKNGVQMDETSSFQSQQQQQQQQGEPGKPNTTLVSTSMILAAQRDAKFPHHRARLLVWLYELNVYFHYKNYETFHLAVNLLDRVCTRYHIQLTSLQALGAACFMIAAKYCEPSPPPMSTLSSLSAGAFDLNHIKRIELDVLEVLKWEIVVPTPDLFLEYLLPMIFTHPKSFYQTYMRWATKEQRDQFVSEVHKRAYKFLYFMQLEFTFIDFRPSILAAAALISSYSFCVCYFIEALQLERQEEIKLILLEEIRTRKGMPSENNFMNTDFNDRTVVDCNHEDTHIQQYEASLQEDIDMCDNMSNTTVNGGSKEMLTPSSATDINTAMDINMIPSLNIEGEPTNRHPQHHHIAMPTNVNEIESSVSSNSLNTLCDSSHNAPGFKDRYPSPSSDEGKCTCICPHKLDALAILEKLYTTENETNGQQQQQQQHQGRSSNGMMSTPISSGDAGASSPLRFDKTREMMDDETDNGSDETNENQNLLESENIDHLKKIVNNLIENEMFRQMVDPRGNKQLFTSTATGSVGGIPGFGINKLSPQRAFADPNEYEMFNRGTNGSSSSSSTYGFSLPEWVQASESQNGSIADNGLGNVPQFKRVPTDSSAVTAASSNTMSSIPSAASIPVNSFMDPTGTCASASFPGHYGSGIRTNVNGISTSTSTSSINSIRRGDSNLMNSGVRINRNGSISPLTMSSVSSQPISSPMVQSPICSEVPQMQMDHKQQTNLFHQQAQQQQQRQRKQIRLLQHKLLKLQAHPTAPALSVLATEVGNGKGYVQSTNANNVEPHQFPMNDGNAPREPTVIPWIDGKAIEDVFGPSGSCGFCCTCEEGENSILKSGAPSKDKNQNNKDSNMSELELMIMEGKRQRKRKITAKHGMVILAMIRADLMMKDNSNLGLVGKMSIRNKDLQLPPSQRIQDEVEGRGDISEDMTDLRNFNVNNYFTTIPWIHITREDVTKESRILLLEEFRKLDRKKKKLSEMMDERNNNGMNNYDNMYYPTGKSQFGLVNQQRSNSSLSCSSISTSASCGSIAQSVDTMVEDEYDQSKFTEEDYIRGKQESAKALRPSIGDGIQTFTSINNCSSLSNSVTSGMGSQSLPQQQSQSIGLNNWGNGSVCSMDSVVSGVNADTARELSDTLVRLGMKEEEFFNKIQLPDMAQIIFCSKALNDKAFKLEQFHVANVDSWRN